MDKEEAIEFLKSMKATLVPRSAIIQLKKNEAIEIAIKALENEIKRLSK